MQLKNLLGSAYGRARDAVSDAREKAQERLVVIGGYSGTLSVKWALVGLLVAFVAGFGLAVKMDFAHFHEFRAKAAALAEKKEKENKKLAAELEVLRLQLASDEANRTRSDQGFVDVINAPGETVCTVPVEKLNLLIVEASR